VAYRFEEGNSGDGELIVLLKADTMLIFDTSNTPAERETGLYGDPLEILWKNNMLISCDVKNYYRKNFRVIITGTLEQRTAWLEEAGQTVEKYFPEVLK